MDAEKEKGKGGYRGGGGEEESGGGGGGGGGGGKLSIECVRVSSLVLSLSREEEGCTVAWHCGK